MDHATGADMLALLIRDWAGLPVFHVPGEGILELVDALEGAGAALVSCRHEAGAVVAAQAAGQVVGRPGIALVGRAPGALNAALALHTARTDGAPMILILGQPSRAIAGREPYLSNADFAQAFAPSAKWVGSCDSAARLVESFSRAWSEALSGRPGPVVLALHEEVWHENIPRAGLPGTAPVVPRPQAAPDDLDRLADALAEARRPLIIAGGRGWTAAEAAALAAFASESGIPVATAYRRRDLMPASHPLMAGELGIGADPVLAAKVAEADCLVVLGMRLGEINTFGANVFEGYRLIEAPVPAQAVHHVHPDPAELHAVYRTHSAILAHPGDVVAGLRARAPKRHALTEWPQSLRAAREAFTTGRPCPGPLDLNAVFRTLRAALPEDAMLTVGAGAYAHWPQRYFPHEVFGTQLGPKSGAMGYGLPAAIGVQAAQPGRRVVAVAGDGCFMMQGEELATAVLYRLPIVTIVVNNSLYGAIAASQSRMFGRRSGTALAPVDFTALAGAMGVKAWKVTATDAFAPALQDSLAEDGPTLIELVTGEEALKP
ncbi:thiamine pyrophosphate-dependent enzyme [Pararhodobacter marinus]|uniref:thiamine pyrophosphate-dependent enzyme n=1 Tax=Pararhodobacter marinus TaxID=2184063 RepID=UPI0035171780